MRSSFWVVLLLLLAGCGPGEDATVRPRAVNRKPNYFDIKSFLDAQVTALDRRQPSVEKQVRLQDGQLETSRVEKVDWGKELQIFYQADINKPALRGAYQVEQPTSLNIVYTRKTGIDAPVLTLAIKREEAAPQVITATVVQDNALFYSKKALRLQADSRGITSYHVEGTQKLVLFDTVHYSVQTRILK